MVLIIIFFFVQYFPEIAKSKYDIQIDFNIPIDVPNYNHNVSSKMLQQKSRSSVIQKLVSRNGNGPRYKVQKTKSRSLTAIVEAETDGEKCCREKGVSDVCFGYCSTETKDIKSRAITGVCEELLEQIDRCKKGCTVFGLAGNGTSRGSCNEMFNCHADGTCKPHCTVRGSKGDGISRGSCAEGRICFSDGSCKVSGPICTVRGSKGDGISRGSCNEGQICFRDGSCKAPGKCIVNSDCPIDKTCINGFCKVSPPPTTMTTVTTTKPKEQRYSLISDKGDCILVSGKSTYTCYRQVVSSQSSCEDYCTSQITCVGYDYDMRGDEHCHLYPSDRSCPSGFTAFCKTRGVTTASRNDLIAGRKDHYACYGKI